jgi:hypothetical protein
MTRRQAVQQGEAAMVEEGEGDGDERGQAGQARQGGGDGGGR